MKPAAAIENFFSAATDRILARWPRRAAAARRLATAALVSHRGEHDNRRVFENTLAAFDRAAAAGVWGLELDVRWSADRQPVVFHDPDLRRLAANPMRLCQATLSRLRAVFAPLATLAEVVARYGGRCHLMIEIKSEVYPDPPVQSAILAQVLSPLRPAADYHLMSLDPAMFRHLGFVPRRCLVPIAWGGVAAFSRLALERGYGGVAGHFGLVGRRCLERHHRHGQQVGCGMVDSPRGVYREVDRGVDWIFSNRAAPLARICGARRRRNDPHTHDAPVSGRDVFRGPRSCRSSTEGKSDGH